MQLFERNEYMLDSAALIHLDSSWSCKAYEGFGNFSYEFVAVALITFEAKWEEQWVKPCEPCI